MGILIGALFKYMTFENAKLAMQKSINRVFGISCTYSYSVGGTSTIKGVFDNAFVEINNVSTKKPILKILLSDLTNEPTEGDTVLINGSNYQILNAEDDSHGTSVLILEKL